MITQLDPKIKLSVTENGEINPGYKDLKINWQTAIFAPNFSNAKIRTNLKGKKT